MLIFSADIQIYLRDNSFTPSPVCSLNGQDPVTTLEDLSLLGVLADRDALYNVMFHSPAVFAANRGDWQGFYGGSRRFGHIWPGPNTAVEFANGTVVNYPTIARVVGNFSDITDGPSFYAKYCSGSRPVSEVANYTSPPVANLPPHFGYPTPVVTASDQSAAGYFLPNTDVAVLSLLSYVSPLRWILCPRRRNVNDYCQPRHTGHVFYGLGPFLAMSPVH